MEHVPSFSLYHPPPPDPPPIDCLQQSTALYSRTAFLRSSGQVINVSSVTFEITFNFFSSFLFYFRFYFFLTWIGCWMCEALFLYFLYFFEIYYFSLFLRLALTRCSCAVIRYSFLFRLTANINRLQLGFKRLITLAIRLRLRNRSICLQLWVQAI